ncbi:GNS1/SUR4 membrane protein [Penicillium camemberti]|uniref:Elongation of fatty acids protein n=1 Tax=Penicillium camemberti (strain FM 013) TaxID=1429867 RepID=A0A0G4P6X7_PENC3|nr:GNS1/SUR4 membrane protein [Penicillium camemberti]
MGSPSPLLHFSLPDAELFKFPPRSDLFPPRPTGEGRSAWDRPFDIPQLLFDYTTEIGFPFCVVFIYIVTSSIFNHVNTKRKFRPWGLSQTGFFHHLVLLHNIALALFSGWMFFGFCKSVVISLPSKQSSHFLVTTADALCKITGDRGLGRGHTRIHRSPASAPNSFGIASVGDRMWHQGLGYFGWIFYVSKVYELVDTVLIITMGKKCSFLQRYHHAGVMLCAWANFRYMVPAYIIPCLLNSFIHTLMYSYYALVTLGVRVPFYIKKCLTGMQITQFLVGIVLTWIYFFLAYDIPVDIGSDEMQDLRFLANKTEDIGKHFIGSRTVHCIDTSGQMFSFVLVMVYVFPLLWLFAQFFVRSYILQKKVKVQ